VQLSSYDQGDGGPHRRCDQIIGVDVARVANDSVVTCAKAARKATPTRALAENRSGICPPVPQVPSTTHGSLADIVITLANSSVMFSHQAHHQRHGTEPAQRVRAVTRSELITEKGVHPAHRLHAPLTTQPCSSLTPTETAGCARALPS
jgi:hypothetical protein